MGTCWRRGVMVAVEGQRGTAAPWAALGCGPAPRPQWSLLGLWGHCGDGVHWGILWGGSCGALWGHRAAPSLGLTYVPLVCDCMSPMCHVCPLTVQPRVSVRHVCPHMSQGCPLWAIRDTGDKPREPCLGLSHPSSQRGHRGDVGRQNF